MRVLLLGLTGAGKTTVAKIIAEKHNFNLVEADDEVIKLNGGWPDDEKIIDKYFEVTNDRVLDLDSILYVISWLTPKGIKEFYDRGFLIIELHANFDELLKRKMARDGMSDEERERFGENYKGYVQDILSDETRKKFTLSLDTTYLTPEEILARVDEVIVEQSMKQTLYIVTGLPFSGKTTLSKELIQRFGFEIASVDEMLDKGHYVVETMSYDDWGVVYDQAFEKLEQLLKDSKTVIFDGGSLKKNERQALKNVAERLGIAWKLIWVNTPVSEIIERRKKNLTTQERDQLEDVTMEKALGMFEEPTSDENFMPFNSTMNVDDWIKENI